MRGCRAPSCTVGVTGLCLLNRDAETCPDRLPEDEGVEAGHTEPEGPLEGGNAPDAKIADLPPPPQKTKLRAGVELGLDDVRRLASRRPCNLIGILGEPDAGKTASLVSLYLKAAKGQMLTFRFANSLSLIAFEQLARGVRRWEHGKIPQQLTAHTKLEDPRSPGFLHLRLRGRTDHQAHDLLFPDLPGEWTEQLIDSNERDRFAFLAAASAMWLMVDGRVVADPDRRKEPVGRLKLMLARLANLIPKSTPIFIVVTRRDEIGPQTLSVLDSVLERAEALGFVRPVTFEIASFSTKPEETPPGFGIEDLIAASLVEPTFSEFATSLRPVRPDLRQMLLHRESHG